MSCHMSPPWGCAFALGHTRVAAWLQPISAGSHAAISEEVAQYQKAAQRPHVTMGFLKAIGSLTFN